MPQLTCRRLQHATANLSKAAAHGDERTKAETAVAHRSANTQPAKAAAALALHYTTFCFKPVRPSEGQQMHLCSCEISLVNDQVRKNIHMLTLAEPAKAGTCRNQDLQNLQKLLHAEAIKIEAACREVGLRGLPGLGRCA